MTNERAPGICALASNERASSMNVIYKVWTARSNTSHGRSSCTLKAPIFLRVSGCSSVRNSAGVDDQLKLIQNSDFSIKLKSNFYIFSIEKWKWMDDGKLQIFPWLAKMTPKIRDLSIIALMVW